MSSAGNRARARALALGLGLGLWGAVSPAWAPAPVSPAWAPVPVSTFRGHMALAPVRAPYWGPWVDSSALAIASALAAENNTQIQIDRATAAIRFDLAVIQAQLWELPR